MRIGESIVGRFVVEQVVGAGMMGVVFRAREISSGRAVAVKVLRANDMRLAARFQREAEVLAHLHAEEIVAYVCDGTTEDGEAFIVMEWAEGETLKQRLDRGGLTILETVDVGARIAAAIGKAHAAGVVHRDLKPANVVLGTNPPATVKVVDFGVAHFRAGGETLTGSGDMIGTPAYMSPEQAKAGDIDGRSDIYSLGCILFRCITGRGTIEAPDAFSAMLKLATEPIPPVATLSPRAPPKLANLVDRMLAADPFHRPQDAASVSRELAELRTEIAALGVDETIEARSPAAGPGAAITSVGTLPAARDAALPKVQQPSVIPVQLGPGARRRRRMWIAVAAFGLAVVATAGGLYARSALGRKPAARRPVASASARASSQPALQATSPAIVVTPAPPVETFKYREKNGKFDVVFDCKPSIQYWEPSLDFGRLTERQLATCSDKKGMTYVSTTDTLTNGSITCEFVLEQTKAALVNAMKCDVESEAPVTMGPISGVSVKTYCYKRTMRGELRVLCDNRPDPKIQIRAITLAVLRFTERWDPADASGYWSAFTFR